MTKCYQTSFSFSSAKRRQVEANFSGGDITSNAGVLLLREADRKLGLSQTVARALGDQRVLVRCEYSVQELIKQRVYGLALDLKT